MKINLSNIKKAKYFLDNDECVGVPTETVYGLAANAYSNKATSKIFKLKKRPKRNPLIVHYYCLGDVKKDCHINEKFLYLYKKFCPGPISFVLKLKKNSLISNNVTNNKNTLAVRFPKHPVLRKLLSNLDYPLAAPSANVSNKISAVSKMDVKDEFGNKIKYILDGGRSNIGLESTIINLVGKPEILRFGALQSEQLKKILRLKKKKIAKNIKILVPGQDKLHYSPGIPLRLNVTKPRPHEALLLIKKKYSSHKFNFYLSKNGNLKEVAKNLYSTLRIIKKKKFKSIAVEKIPNDGIGEAINDRLMKASKFK